MASKANGAASKASQQTKVSEGAASPYPSIKELEELELGLQRDLVRLENDIYITETKYIR